MAKALPAIRVELHRGGIVESSHTVHAVLWSAQGAVARYGDPKFLTTLRSSWKAIQGIPFVADGVADALGVSDATLAVIAGSHSGQPEHVALVHDLLDRAGLSDADLQCGGHRPYHAPSADALAGSHGRIHDNCSGKHAAMLAWAAHQGHNLATYAEPQHPVQARALGALASLLDLAPDNIPQATDGCSVPTPALPLQDVARLFALVAAADRESANKDVRALARIRDAVTANPLLVAGTGRADTEVIGASAGRIWTKAGAEGLWAGVDQTTGIGFACRAVDGEFRAPVPAALELLASQGNRDVTLPEIRRWRRPVIKDRQGNAVGELVAFVPEGP